MNKNKFLRERAERMYDADRVSGEFARVLKEI